MDAEPKAVSEDDVKEFCNRKGIKYFQVSAKSAENVAEAFLIMTKACMAKNPKL